MSYRRLAAGCDKSLSRVSKGAREIIATGLSWHWSGTGKQVQVTDPEAQRVCGRLQRLRHSQLPDHTHTRRQHDRYTSALQLPRSTWSNNDVQFRRRVRINILVIIHPFKGLCLQCFDAVGWADRKGIRPVKNWAVGCWRGYLSGARCRLAHGPADATATHCLLLQ